MIVNAANNNLIDFESGNISEDEGCGNCSSHPLQRMHQHEHRKPHKTTTNSCKEKSLEVETNKWILHNTTTFNETPKVCCSSAM